MSGMGVHSGAHNGREHRTGSKAEQCAPDKRNAGNADECCQKAGNGQPDKSRRIRERLCACEYERPKDEMVSC